MAMAGPSDDQRVHDAITRLRAQLEATLADVAQRAVDEELLRLRALDVRGLRISAGAVKVAVTGLTVDVGRPPVSSPRAATGRPPGPLRQAVLAIVSAASAPVSPGEVRRALEAAGQPTSQTNLHQLLTRLVQAGAVVRVGRGRYRAA